MAILRRRSRRADDESAAPLYVDFDDEDESFDSGETENAAPAERSWRRWRPRPPAWWSRLSLRSRILAGAIAAALVTALVVGALVVQADRRAHDRITVSAVDGAYVPSSDGEGLDLILSLRDDGPAVATLYWVGVDQPGLALGYPPLPLPMRVGHVVGIRLLGRYLCTGSAGSGAKTFTAVVQSPRGVVSYLTVAMPPGVVLPEGWQSAREGFCQGMALAQVPRLP